MYGYAAQVLDGLGMTLSLVLFSLVLSTVIGIAAALGKLSGWRPLQWLLNGYTTLIRSVPDLVLMLLIFFNIQALVNVVTETLGWQQIDIDPFAAGVVTLAFIYGAYMAETFRGALAAVPRGHIEAGLSTGMSGFQVFYVISLPEMVRFGLASYANNSLVIIKATALVSLLGLQDIVSITQNAGQASRHPIYFNLVAALLYLVLTCIVLFLVHRLGKRYSLGVRKGVV